MMACVSFYGYDYVVTTVTFVCSLCPRQEPHQREMLDVDYLHGYLAPEPVSYT